MSKPKFVSTAGPRGPRARRLQRRYAGRPRRNRVYRELLRELYAPAVVHVLGKYL
jgi:hypothetical protein